MKIPVVDIGTCTLCMGCVEVCPEVFQQNDAGFIEVVELDVYPREAGGRSHQILPGRLHQLGGIMKKVALFVFNGDPVCFIHVLLNGLDMKAKGMDGRIIVEGAATALLPKLAEPAEPIPQAVGESQIPGYRGWRVQGLRPQNGNRCRGRQPGPDPAGRHVRPSRHVRLYRRRIRGNLILNGLPGYNHGLP
jgi:ferredoxin